MDHGLFQFGLTAFVTLLVVVDPIGVAPIFVSVTRDQTRAQRQTTLQRAVVIAFLVTVFFLFAGRVVLTQLGVSVHAFAISGGILLFATALPMLFGHRPAMQGPGDGGMVTSGEDLAVFPLAIPLLSGPGAIATILLNSSAAGSSPARLAVLLLATVGVFAAVWVILFAAEQVITRLGPQRILIITRVLGIVLAALAVQYVLDGIAGYYQALARP